MSNSKSPEILSDQLPFDSTTINFRELINPSLWDQVIASAWDMQTINDLPFKPGNIIFHPDGKYPYQVIGVFDNRHRILKSIDLQCTSTGDHMQEEFFRDRSVVHLGYLLEALKPHDSLLSPIEGQTMSEILAQYVIALVNNGIIEELE
ncbi:MAG: hypothetical protein ABII80_00020 [bacterium]